MSNPYKNAERRRQEEAERKRKEAEEKKKAEEIAQTTLEEPKEVEVVTTHTEPEKPTESTEEAVATDLLSDLTVEKNASKSFSFYLKIENVKKLERAAKKNGVSVSKLLDHIISKL